LRGSDSQRSHYRYRDTEQIDWFPPIYKCKVENVVEKMDSEAYKNWNTLKPRMCLKRSKW
jgi:hypothetical protein